MEVPSYILVQPFSNRKPPLNLSRAPPSREEVVCTIFRLNANRGKLEKIALSFDESKLVVIYILLVLFAFDRFIWWLGIGRDNKVELFKFNALHELEAIVNGYFTFL